MISTVSSSRRSLPPRRVHAERLRTEPFGAATSQYDRYRRSCPPELVEALVHDVAEVINARGGLLSATYRTNAGLRVSGP